MPIDYSNYPPDWKTRIRPDILERAGHRCEFCGIGNYMEHPATGSQVVLTVAHIDQNIENNDYANLAALCQRCHNRLDMPYRIAHRAANRMQRLEKRGQLRLI
jgi:5-methylcytosine-specific restriction endonuclease McrA